MRSSRWLLAAIGSVVSASAVEAQIFKDQFDTYTGTYLAANSGGVWVLENGYRDGKLSDVSDWTAPNGVSDLKDGTTNLRSAFRSRHHLTSSELLHAGLVEGTNPNSVNGTDANPLVLSFYLYLGTWTSTKMDPYYRMNNFVELACGDDTAPTSMVVSTCNGIDLHHLNLQGDGLLHKTIAVGQVAMADTDPCDDSTAPYQRNFRLSVYDGMRWHFFTTNELHTCAGFNWVELTVRTNEIQIRIQNKYNSTLGTCDRASSLNTRSLSLPRQYKGQFTAIAMGGLRNEATGQCWDQNNDPGYPSQESGFDDVELAGGVASNVPGACEDTGACCKPDHSCAQMTPTECASIPDAAFNGLGTLCWVGEGRCCAAATVDGDFDTDVDMVDFAMLQRCIAPVGGVAENCTCFDTNADGAVDSTDVERFALCASGSGVPADVTCDSGL